jgi:small subunit ribosomal protein S21|tara:strand:- start:728 stop:943 length:216 start_codon:yes stop_codon:yes gene_type:complete
LIKVEVRKGQSIEKALAIFKKKVKQSGMMLELRERSYYEKPSAIKREKKNKAILRNKYKVLKEKEKDNLKK